MPNDSSDGCLTRTGRQITASGSAISKEAGISLYLLEELGDARLHCAQLSHYIDLARQIVEKSNAKDHIYEVAGHLLQAIPEHLFKLEKSLQAVALAADRMDYEDLKQELKPDKVQELERVLKEVRIRAVPHRSEPRPMMNPIQASEELQKIAVEIRSTGKVPVDRVSSLLSGLEGQEKTASDMKPMAEMLDGIATALKQPNTSPSRLHLAATLRKVMADNLLLGCDLMSGCTPMGGELATSPEEDEAKRSRFEKGQPADPTQNMDPEQKKEWEAKNEEHGDKFKEAALDPGPMPRMELIKSDSLVAYRRGTAGNWRFALMALTEVVENIGFLVNELGGGMDAAAKAALLNREIIKARRNLKPSATVEPPVLTAASHDEALKQLMKEFPELKSWPKGDLDQTLHSTSPHQKGEGAKIQKRYQQLLKKAAEEHDGRFEEGKPADPTENMSPEDAAKWKVKNEEHGDKFKEATASPAVLRTLVRQLAMIVRDLATSNAFTQFSFYAGVGDMLTAQVMLLKKMGEPDLARKMQIIVNDLQERTGPLMHSTGWPTPDPELDSEYAAKTADAWKVSIERSPAQFIAFLERMVGGVEDAAVQMRHSLTAYSRDPGKNAPQLGNLFKEAASLDGQLQVLKRSMPKNVVFASAEDARRVKTALRQFDNYSDELHKLQSEFTGMAGQAFAEWATAFHRQIGLDAVNWDWGYAVPKGKDAAEIRVWLKDTPILPVFRDVDPNFLIHLTFDAEGDVTIKATSGSFKLADRSVPAGKASPGYIGASLGESWERFLRGSLDFGHPDQRIRAPE